MYQRIVENIQELGELLRLKQSKSLGEAALVVVVLLVGWMPIVGGVQNAQRTTIYVYMSGDQKFFIWEWTFRRTELSLS